MNYVLVEINYENTTAVIIVAGQTLSVELPDDPIESQIAAACEERALVYLETNR